MAVGNNMYWGPVVHNQYPLYTMSVSYITLNDSDNAMASGFLVPKTGTITDVGFHCLNVTGNPPAYNVGLVTADGSGNPTTTAYGGSANTTYDFTSTGWHWITLATAATNAAVGDACYAHVWPVSGSAPDASNYVRIPYGAHSTPIGHLWHARYTTSWARQTAWCGALKYDDGTVVGASLTSVDVGVNIRTSSTPDELGCLFQVPFQTKCIGGVFHGYIGTNQDFQIVLYNASDDVLGSWTADESQYMQAAGSGLFEGQWTEVTLSADTNYRIVVKPTTANTGLYVYTNAVNETGSRNWFQEGSRWQRTGRADAGAWTETTTSLPQIGLILSDLSGITA